MRPIEATVIWARDADKAESLADSLSRGLEISVTAEADPERAVAGADIMVTTTPATQPILFSGWLRPGQHVTAMGSDAEHKNELDPSAIAKADLYVADSRAQVAVLGELHHAISRGIVSADAHIPQLGDIVAGETPGRTSEDQVTICDLTGTGVQDTAIATLARERMAGKQAGTVIESRGPVSEAPSGPQ